MKHRKNACTLVYAHRKVRSQTCKWIIPDSQFCPIHPSEQWQVSGATHSPPFRHVPGQMAGTWEEHTRKRSSSRGAQTCKCDRHSHLNTYSTWLKQVTSTLILVKKANSVYAHAQNLWMCSIYIYIGTMQATVLQEVLVGGTLIGRWKILAGNKLWQIFTIQPPLQMHCQHFLLCIRI